MTDELRKAAEAAQKIAPGQWERDSERQSDTPDRHDEYVLLDGRGYRLCDTTNSDSEFGEIHSEYDGEDGTYHAWNEPSRVVMDYLLASQPAAILALLDQHEAALAAERARADALAKEVERVVPVVALLLLNHQRSRERLPRCPSLDEMDQEDTEHWLALARAALTKEAGNG